MRIVVALSWMLLAGCGAQRASTVPTAASTCPPASRWREMTWSEYYMDVEERAWRTGGRVIWVDPPRVDKTVRTQLSCR